MRLIDVARRFDKTVCNDAYTGDFAFNAQLDLFDDNKRDSETAERRILSTSADVVLPARRTISAAGTTFIIGHANPDTYMGDVIRVGYAVQEAPTLSQVRTLAQVCLNQAGFTAFAGRAWVKDLAYSQQSSVETPLHHIHYASTEPIVPNMLVTFDGRLNVVRSLNYGAGGTLVAACEQMVEPSVETATVHRGTYDPVQDTHTDVPTTERVIRVRWQSMFAYGDALAPKFEPGDIQLVFGAAVIAGTTLQLSDGLWRVQSAVVQGSVWLCRAQRYG